MAYVEESKEEIESESPIFMLFTCVGDLFSNREIHHSRSVALQTYMLTSERVNFVTQHGSCPIVSNVNN